MNNFEVLQEYEKAGVPLPRLEELKELKTQLSEHKDYCCCQKNEALLLENARLKERDKIYSELAENLLCIEEENGII